MCTYRYGGTIFGHFHTLVESYGKLWQCGTEVSRNPAPLHGISALTLPEARRAVFFYQVRKFLGSGFRTGNQPFWNGRMQLQAAGWECWVTFFVASDVAKNPRDKMPRSDDRPTRQIDGEVN